MTRSDGYVLELAGHQIDALQFEGLAAEGRRLLGASRLTDALSALDDACRPPR